MSEEMKKTSPVAYVHLVIMLAFMFLFRLITPPAPITPYGMAVLGIFIGLIYGWTFLSAEYGLSAISFLGLLALGMTDFGAVSTSMASVFASDTAALLLFGFLLVGPVMECNVADVVVAKLLNSKFCAGKPWNFAFLVIVIFPLVTIAINAFIVALLVVAIMAKVFSAAGFKKGDKTPVMFIIGFFVTLEISAALLPWRGWGLYCVSAFRQSSGGYSIDYSKYMILAFLFYIVLSIGYLLVMKVFGCNLAPLKDVNINSLVGENASKEMTKQQKYILWIFILFAVSCVIVSFAGGAEGIRLIIRKFGVHGCMLTTLVAFLFVKADGKHITDIKVMGRNIMWDMMLVIAVALVVAGALTSADTGISAAMGKYAAPILMGKNELVVLMLLGIISLVLTNLSNNTAVMFVFMAVAGQMYANGIITNAPAALLIINFATLLGFYTPGASAYGAMIHSFELSTSAQVYKYGLVAVVWIFIALAVSVIPLSTMIF